jgi:hypothetical protein
VEASVQNIVLPVTPISDQRVWPLSKDGKLSAKSAFLFLHGSRPSLVWPGIVWRSCIPPSHSFTFWRLMHGKLPTDENLQRRGCSLVSVCALCFATVETSVHLFLECDFSLHLWRWLETRLRCVVDCSSVGALLNCLQPRESFLFMRLSPQLSRWWLLVVVCRRVIVCGQTCGFSKTLALLQGIDGSGILWKLSGRLLLLVG